MTDLGASEHRTSLARQRTFLVALLAVAVAFRLLMGLAGYAVLAVLAAAALLGIFASSARHRRGAGVCHVAMAGAVSLAGLALLILMLSPH